MDSPPGEGYPILLMLKRRTNPQSKSGKAKARNPSTTKKSATAARVMAAGPQAVHKLQSIRTPLRVPRGPSNPSIRKYMIAVSNPFHVDAEGARLPFYPLRGSAPLTIRWKANILHRFDSTASSGRTKSAIFLPNPNVYAYVQPNNPAYTTADAAVAYPDSLQPVFGPVAQVAWSGLGATTRGIPGAVCDNVNINVSRAANFVQQPRLTSIASQWRVVAGGVRISSQEGSGVTHRPITLSRVPASTNHVPYPLWNGEGPDAGIQGSSNLTTSSQVFQNLTGSSLEQNNLFFSGPETQNYSTWELTMNPVQSTMVPIGPRAFAWKDSDQSGDSNISGSAAGSTDVTFIEVNARNINGTEVYENNLARQFNTELLDNSDWLVPAYQIAALPTGTVEAVDVVMTVEYVLHLEIIPRMLGYIPNTSQPTYFSPGLAPGPGAYQESSHLSQDLILDLIKRADSGIRLIRGGMDLYSRYVGRPAAIAATAGARIEL